MKKTYKAPVIEVVAMQAPCNLLAGSEINGGGNLGNYTPGTQESRHGRFFDDDEEEEY